MKRTPRRKSDQSAGKGRTRISTTITEATDAELCRLAEASSLTRAAMARECISDAVARPSPPTRATRAKSLIIPWPTPETPPPALPTMRERDINSRLFGRQYRSRALVRQLVLTWAKHPPKII
jgi:hypothetical protein